MGHLRQGGSTGWGVWGDYRIWTEKGTIDFLMIPVPELEELQQIN